MAKEEVIIDADNTYKDPRAVYDDVGNIINQVYDDTPNLKRDALGNVIGNVNIPPPPRRQRCGGGRLASERPSRTVRRAMQGSRSHQLPER